METQIFEMGPNGSLQELQELQEAPTLANHSRVYAFGGSMSESIYAIIPDGDKSQRLVKMSKHYKNDYFSVFQRFNDRMKPLSKKFGIGFYYDDKDPKFRFSTEEINKAISTAEAVILQQDKDAAELLRKNNEKKKILPSLYPHLTPLDKNAKDYSKKNLVAHLKKTFPGIKFSVRKEHYSTMNVTWTDGPCKKDVNDITNMFEDSVNDVTGDFRDYSPSIINNIFGGFKYIFSARNLSPEIESLRDDLQKLLPQQSLSEIDNIFYRILVNTSFPTDYSLPKIKRTDVKAGSIEDFYKITYHTPKVTSVKDKTPDKDIELIDYSDRAIAIIGNTKPIKDILKNLNGRFNFRLKCGPGWIFPKKREQEIRSTLNI